MNNPESPTRGRGRPRSFSIPDAVQKAALVFWKHGYEGTSVEELTDAMGITTQSLYAAFGSKAELYRQALAWYEQDAVLPVRECLAEPDVLRAIERTLQNLAVRFTRPESPRGCMRSAAMLHYAVENHEIGAHLASLRAETLQAIRARLDQAVKEGLLRRDTKTKECAGFLHVVMSGMSVAAQDGATEADLLPYAAMAVSYLDRMMTKKATAR